jgi:hypothetical protein
MDHIPPSKKKTNVKKPTFYEQVGIIIPGAVLLFGLIIFIPTLRDFIMKDGVTVGQLGIFLLLSYAAGNLVAALGNVGENLMWRVAGGMPSEWIIKSETTLISPQQSELIEKKIRTRLGVVIGSLRGLDRKVWWPISRQIYSDVQRHGSPDRIDTFNGNYGLNRGLAAACLILACVAATQQSWPACGSLLAITTVYAYRAYRFGVHYARELYLQFLTISDTAAATKVRKKETMTS